MGKTLFISAGLLLIAGCFGSTLRWSSTEGGLTVVPALRYLGFNRTFVFSVTGGVPPYSVSHSGAGSFDAATSTYSSGTSAGTARLTAVDSEGAVGGADIVVGPSGQLDASFGVGGFRQFNIQSTDAVARGLAIDSQGRILVAGSVGVATAADSLVLRLTASGDPDPSFGSAGIAVRDLSGGLFEDHVLAMALDSEERIVLAGTGEPNLASPLQGTVARLTADGAVDPQFATVFIPGSATDLGFHAVRVAADGEIAVSGFKPSGPDGFAARVTSSGAMANSFNAGALKGVCPGCTIRGMVLDAAENLIMIGTKGTEVGHTVTKQDGSIELQNNGFGSPAADAGLAIVRQSDGKYIVVGSHGSDFGVARLNSDFTVETAYFPISFTGASTGKAVAIDHATGDIVIGGSISTDQTSALARVNGAMVLDLEFGTGGKFQRDFSASADTVTALAIDAAGRIVGAGHLDNASTDEIFVFRLTP